MGSDFYDESEFNEKVAELGLEPTTAYIRVARGKKKRVSDAAKTKREYRAMRKAQGLEQYVVAAPIDADAKRTVYAVAQAIVEDKENTKICGRSSLVVSSPELLKLSDVPSTSSVDVSSVVEPIERADWATIAESHAAHPALIADLPRLAKPAATSCRCSIASCVTRTASRRGLPKACWAPQLRRMIVPRFSGYSRSASGEASVAECSVGYWARSNSASRTEAE